MQIERFVLSSKRDEVPLAVIRVTPDGERKAVVQILHGMCEHKERYLPFMEYLAEQGYASVIHDHRGHGESVKESEDYGYFYEEGATSIVEDVYQINQFTKESFPELPCYLMGHSMGSLVARAYIKKYDHTVSGLIVCGSPSDNPMSGFGIAMAKAGGKLFGEKQKATALQGIMFKNHNKGITDPSSVNAWICANESVVSAYDEDELCGFTFTYNGMENLCRLVQAVYGKNGWEMNQKSLPIHFISGKEDPCLTSEKKFIQAVDHVRNRGYQNVSYTLYEGMRHEILNEAENRKVYQDVVSQLDVWADR